MPRLDLTPGTVVILASETARYTSFWNAAMSLTGGGMPPGSSIQLMVGSDISESRNQALLSFQRNEAGGDWIWFIDDDHQFEPGTLLQLISRGVDIVTPLCLRRSQPFLPVPTGLDDNFLDLRKLGSDDLVEVQAAGTSGMLIRRSVVDALVAPWFELGYRESDTYRISEDVWFCMKAREAGLKIHVDLAATIAHLTTCAIWPTWSEEEGRWLTGLTVADGAEFYIEPAVVPEQLKVGDVTGPEAVPVPEPS